MDTKREPVTPYMRMAVMGRDEHVCVYCGTTEEESKLQIDHAIPVSKGGRSNFENLVTCCQHCNYWKGNRTVEEWDADEQKLHDRSLFTALLERIKKRSKNKKPRKKKS